MRRLGPSRDLGVSQCDDVSFGERRRAGEHLVERRSERVQIRSPVDRQARAAGLFRRHVGQRAFEPPGIAVLHGEGRKGSRDGEIAKRCGRALRVPDDVAGLDVTMNDPGTVHPRHRVRKLDGDVQELADRQTSGAHELREIGIPGVLHQERQAAFHGGHRQHVHDPGKLELSKNLVFLRQRCACAFRGNARGTRFHHHGRAGDATPVKPVLRPGSDPAELRQVGQQPGNSGLIRDRLAISHRSGSCV